MAAGMGLEQELRVYVSVHKHEAEKEITGSGVYF